MRSLHRCTKALAIASSRSPPLPTAATRRRRAAGHVLAANGPDRAPTWPWRTLRSASASLHSVSGEKPVKVTAAMVKELREITGAPMMDCKKALMDEMVNGDQELAIEWLRKHGVASAASKADRVTNDGLVGIIKDGRLCSIVEVSSETDFVARNELFQELVENIARTALVEEAVSSNYLERATLVNGENNESVEDAIARATATIRENLSLKASEFVSVENGFIGTYLHNKRGENLCTQGAIIALEASTPIDDKETLEKTQELANGLAMQLVACQAMYLERVPKAVMTYEQDLESEKARNEILEKLAEEDKTLTDEVLEKRIKKKVQKYMKRFEEENVLLNQQYVAPAAQQKETVKKLLERTSKELKNQLVITKGVRFAVGKKSVVMLLMQE